MKLRLIVVGGMGNKHLRALCEDFSDRVEKLLPFELIEVRDGKAKEGEKRLEEEAETLLRKGEGGSGRLIGWTAWDAGGKALASESLADWLAKRERESQRQTWIIGSSHGLSPKLKAACEHSLGLGPMTYTHEMARFLVLEQLYRALCIQRHLPYHH
jgi:23S rRNA (pseudouridine1915-N3)-methyltransferase